MRELKFRVWNEFENKFMPSGFIGISDGKFIDLKNGSVHFDSDDKIVEQFTGLCDRNGKEIYEGDIVICKARNDKEDKRRIGQNYISEVFWDVDGWFVHDSPLCDSPLGMFDNTPSRRPIASIEVIGNIHENGDLLK